MNTLTPFHLALEDSLGESVDRINAQAEAAIVRIDEMAAKADARTAYDLARFRWRELLAGIYGIDSDVTLALASARYRSHAEQAEHYSAYLAGRSLHDRGATLDVDDWHYDLTKEHR